MRRWLTVVAALLVVGVAPAEAAAPTLPARLAQALAVPRIAAGASAAIAIDLTTDATLFARNADTPLLPASNEKLATTFAALTELGPYYRFRTEVLGVGFQDGATWDGDLVLKGYGDPTLSSAGLADLAAQLRAQGIRTVTGHVVGDESWFDARRMVAGWKRGYYMNESPPLSALTVDRDRYHGRMATKPPLAAAATFQEVLHAHGVTAGTPLAGRAPPEAFALASVESPPLADVLAFMDRESDNFTAEIVLKEIGAEIGGAGTSAVGAAVAADDLAAAGVPITGVRIVDGSGLSRSDRVTARELATLLVLAWNDPDMHDVVWNALPMPGTGTLDHRLRVGPARALIHAKTGTTNVASALSGYVGDRYVFSIVQNGYPVSTWWARHAQDAFAQALATDATAP